jgi:endoglucanase
LDNFFNTLCKWNAHACVQGQCESIRGAICERAGPLCDEVRVLPGGTMICRIAGEGKPLMLWANMGNAGFCVSGVDEKGFARAAAIGVSPSDCDNTPLRTPDGMRAVLRADGTNADNTGAGPAFFLDFGENGERLPPLGTPLVYDAEPARLIRGRVRAPFAGSHVPAAVLQRLMEAARAWRRELYFVFADGADGAAQAAYAVRPACVLTLTAAEAADACAEPENRNVLRIGGGAVLKLRDRNAPCLQKALPRAAELAASRTGTALQYDLSARGEAGYAAVQFQNGGLPMIALAVPVRYIDTPVCICDLGDLKALTALAAALCCGKEAL